MEDPKELKNGSCKRCGRKLKDQISIERGFGKICLKKHLLESNKPHGLFKPRKDTSL